MDAKSEMQNKTSKNGITSVLVGGSGRGKSTLLRKIFIDCLYEDKENIPIVSTESQKSNAFQDLPKTVVLDGKGVDQDMIHFCYNMNQSYDKKYNFVIMIDDCIHLRHQKMVEKMMLTMRNSNITSAISLQHAKLLPPSIRNSAYFSFCFGFNGREGSEACIRTWLGGYIPGKNMDEKVSNYQDWVEQGDGHRFFLLDNLNHKCYRVDENYQCEILPLLPFSSKYEKDLLLKPINESENDTQSNDDESEEETHDYFEKEEE